MLKHCPLDPCLEDPVYEEELLQMGGEQGATDGPARQGLHERPRFRPSVRLGRSLFEAVHHGAGIGSGNLGWQSHQAGSPNEKGQTRSGSQPEQALEQEEQEGDNGESLPPSSR